MAIGPRRAILSTASRAPGKSTDAPRSSASSWIAFSSDQRRDLGVAHVGAAVARNRPERADVVIPEILRVVLGFGEAQAVRGQHVAKRAEMKGFAVGEDAVEVEDDRLDHDPAFFMRSPA